MNNAVERNFSTMLQFASYNTPEKFLLLERFYSNTYEIVFSSWIGFKTFRIENFFAVISIWFEEYGLKF